MEKTDDEIEQWYADHPYLSADAVDATAARVLRTGDGIEQTFPDEETILHIFSINPGFGIFGSPETAYAAIVVYSTEELNASLEEAFTEYLIIFLAGLVFAGGVGYAVAYTLGRPVDQIAEDVNRIADGDLTHEIRRTNSHELRRLEDSIRILVTRLGEDIAQIQAQSTALDIELKEKTRVEHRLLDANRKLSLLSTITRHDVLNQLGVLGMYCDLLGEFSEECPELGQYISRMEETLAKIERQLTFTRDYESMGLEEPRFQVLSDVIQNALISVHTPHIRFSVETDGMQVCADPMLEKVFYNLFENAIRHGGEGLSEIAVSVVAVPGMPAQIVVTDNGDGVPEAKKHKIFQQGYGSNTGYGLFLVAEILSITGITIRECGIEGVGARFECNVPPACWRRQTDA
jgi:signal transduction histidine kinase